MSDITIRDRATLARSRLRLVVMVVVGLAAGIAAGFDVDWVYAAVIGWAAACVVFITWVWLAIAPMDAEATRSHATREDPNHRISDGLVLLASVASLGVVVYSLAATKHSSGGTTAVLAAIAVGSAALSWTLVHTLFTLRYARLYYSLGASGISFNQTADPRYTDFAYVAFTLGMTFQVSDTNITDHTIRATVLRHSLLSYLFGSVILGMVINLIVELAA